VVDETSATCEQACKGACCGYDPENGYVPLEISPATRSDCENAGGEFQGVGTTECLGCIKDGVDQGTRCRLPFDGCCCEEKTSTGYGLTFYQPRDKRMPPFSDTVQVTVEFTTLSPILIHGDLFEASAYNNCNKALTFLLCWDAFNVEPFPCGTRFAGLDIKVCWDQYATDVETLKFSGCNDITVWLGNCQYECETFMTYEGGGHTSNASVVLHGDGTIYANGTGPLVLTSNITHAGNCDRTLTLAGTNDQLNEVRRILDPGGSPVCHVVKDGPGRWRLNATSRSFNGDLTVKNGTLQIAHGGAVGSTVKIGGGGSATFLLEENVTTNVSFDVLAASGRILIGGVNDSGLATYSSGEIRMGHPVTLAATTGGSVDFSNSWAGPSSGSTCTQDVIIGAVGFAGTALLNYSGTLHTTGEVFIANGDVVLGLDTVLSADGGITLRDNTSLRITGADGIDPSSQVTAEDSTLTIEAEDGDPAATQSLDDLVVTGSLTIDGTGSLTIEESLTGDGSITIDGVTMTLNTKSMMTGEMSIAVGTLIVNELVDNPGGLVESATFTSSTLTVTFTGDPQTGDEYVLLSGPTANSYGTVTMTGTSMTGTYDSSTSTLTID
jgi:autotransporter-associated beta strand protein